MYPSELYHALKKSIYHIMPVSFNVSLEKKFPEFLWVFPGSV